MSVPTFREPADRKRLVREYGLPNAAPLPGQSLFTRGCRELFVDDDRDGEPVAYFLPLPVPLYSLPEGEP